MDFKKAMQRIGWRFGEGKSFLPNENDKEAYNVLVKFFVNHQKQQFKNNELFAKLYIHVYGKFLKHYKATVMDQIPRRELLRIIEKPLNQIVEEFRQDLNDSELYQLLESSGIEIKHPAFFTDAEKKENVSKVSGVGNEVLNKKYEWSYSDVADCLEKEVNHAINISHQE